MRAKAVNRSVAIEPAEMRSQGVIERALPFRFPHQSIEIVRFEPIFDHREEKIPGVRIIETGALTDPSINIHLRDLFKVGHEPRIVSLFEQAIGLHAARLRLGDYVAQDVELAQLRRANVLYDAVGVKRRMNARITSAMNLVVLLRAMVRKWLPGHLPASEAASVGEYGGHEDVHARLFLKNVEHLINAFVHKGAAADLNGNELLFRRRARRRNGLLQCTSRQAFISE